MKRTNRGAVFSGAAKAVRTALLAAALVVSGGVLFTGTASADVGTCTNQVNDPHLSAHVSGQVNVTGTTTCTIYVAGIWQTIELYQNGVPMAYGYNYQTAGGFYAFVQANTACVPGVYYATLSVYITGASTNPSELRSNTVTISSC